MGIGVPLPGGLRDANPLSVCECDANQYLPRRGAKRLPAEQLTRKATVTQHPPWQPPGNYPPPQYQGGGYWHRPLPWPAGGGRGWPHSPYTSWFERVGAALIDGLIPAVIGVIGLIFAASMGQLGTIKCPTPSTPMERLGPHGDNDFPWYCHLTWTNWGAVIMIVVAGLLALTFGLWNLYRQGKTGSTLGKSVLKFKVVSEKTGQPIGVPMSIVRQIAHIVDAAVCYIGYLLPLWNQKRQTLADMIMSTVCVPIDAGATRTH
ncbi:MAG: RDD family protein [Mycobacterium sp.]